MQNLTKETHVLVSRYISALTNGEWQKSKEQLFVTDRSLYFDNIKPWFDLPMLFWSDYIYFRIINSKITPPRKRSVIRYVPIFSPIYKHYSEAQEHWLRIRIGPSLVTLSWSL